ncbi:carboxymuconolactone decarboxylase family protein [Xanthomonas theicola]|uniref:Alkylhydroperoxidase n=1 Tax=Xanthomonas theicola TaxID=56464 RepID=A0A2S6ZGH6_9XANT|nr:carboxymuconolactone decarboxylase family protein [Xanthomonas theicola]PPT91352.1 alkylhydroperoxidase [Xanthomonas theicola]QNH24389.1 carboxymuconolactone decarboxylase family protein [Xanthomonas theicola]
MHFHRIDYTRHEPGAFRALLAASQHVHDGVLGAELAELVFLRVSQRNGCTYCIDMHATALRKAGIEPRKLDTVAGWHESRFFDPRERAALAWAEALTTLPSGAPPQAAYDALATHFEDRGISALTMAIAVINA